VTADEWLAWRACELGEQPWDRQTPFCAERCAACLTIATVELNKLIWRTTPAAQLTSWHEIIAVTAGMPGGAS
jgi:hypothetical protein